MSAVDASGREVVVKRRVFSKAFKKTAVERVSAGETVADVARSMGFEAAIMYAWIELAANGPVAKTRKIRTDYTRRFTPRRAPEHVVRMVLDDLEAGLSWREIRDRYQVSDPTIWRWAKASGRFGFGADRTVVEDAAQGVAGRRTHWLRRWANPSRTRAALEILLDLTAAGCGKAEIVSKTGLGREVVARLGANALKNGVVEPADRRSGGGSGVWDESDAPSSKGRAEGAGAVAGDDRRPGISIGLSAGDEAVFEGYVAFGRNGGDEDESFDAMMSGLAEAMGGFPTCVLTVRGPVDRMTAIEASVVSRLDPTLSVAALVLGGRLRIETRRVGPRARRS